MDRIDSVDETWTMSIAHSQRHESRTVDTQSRHRHAVCSKKRALDPLFFVLSVISTTRMPYPELIKALMNTLLHDGPLSLSGNLHEP